MSGDFEGSHVGGKTETVAELRQEAACRMEETADLREKAERSANQQKAAAEHTVLQQIQAVVYSASEASHSASSDQPPSFDS
jgi:hypothetical protein